MLSKNQVRYLHSLRHGKFRDMKREFTAEGIKLVNELMNSHFIVKKIFALEGWHESHRLETSNLGIAVQEVAQNELEKISNLVTPNEVFAIVGYPETQIPGPGKMGKLVLALDRIQDPGNLGTIIRIADWFGIKHVFCSEGTADIYNPKVIQATMGSICRVGIHYVDLLQKLESWQGKLHIYGTVSDAANIYTTEVKFPAVILIGNESRGIGEEYFPLMNIKLGIPGGASGAESLNAAVAAGIVCSEFSRRIKN